MSKRLLFTVLIFIFAVFVNGALTQSGNFPDPDSFYHTRMALLMRDTPVVQNFPWLTQTIFADEYVDHHWLYHLVLVPFVSFGDPIFGVRVATLLFASLVPALAFLILSSWGQKRIAALASILLILNNPFGFRMNLVKVPAVSVLFVLVAIWAISKQKRILLAVIAAAYVLAYNGWPMLLVIVGAYIAADIISAFLVAQTSKVSWLDVLQKNSKLLFSVLVGIAIGLVIHPYFPENILFSWNHIVQIGILGFRDQIGVGGEWYPISPLTMIAQSSFVIGFFAAGAVGVIVALGTSRGRAFFDRAFSADRQRMFWFLILAIGFFILTANARRNVEYFIPFVTMAGATMLFFAARVIPVFERQKFISSFWKIPLFARALLLVFFAIMIPLVLFRDMRSLKHDYDTGISPTKYSGTAMWLEENAPKDSILWHNDWDDFPYFFLHTTHVRFIVGLDPAFMFMKDQQKYWQWVAETRGERGPLIGRELRRDFGASYAFVDHGHEALKDQFAADIEMHEVYRDDDGILYVLPE